MIQNSASPVFRLGEQFFQMTAQWEGRGIEGAKQVCEAMQRHPLLALVIANSLFLAATSQLASCLMISHQSKTNQPRKK